MKIKIAIYCVFVISVLIIALAIWSKSNPTPQVRPISQVTE